MTAARGFGSDNQAGVMPEVLAAIGEANVGHAGAYGDDPWTRRCEDAFRELFGPTAETFLVFNGTGANVMGLASLLRPWEAVVCADTAHILEDECGAPERFTGSKLLGVSTPDGRLTPELVEPLLGERRGEHQSVPAVLSVTQLTELGTAYTVGELRALSDLAHAHGMLVHMDGARLGNAVAGLGVEPRAVVTDAGVDVLSFGGTKAGLMLGEAVVFLDPALARDARFVRKQAAQLASKMRFVAAQFLALLANGLWLRAAGHANSMARRLAAGASAVPGVALTQQVDGNEVFATLPAEHVAALQEAVRFYTWDETRSEVRLVTSWDTTAEDVDAFVALLHDTLS